MDLVMFTIFTPTFNRAHTLHRVYESLKAQTYRNFEWMIVDDGSSDHTDGLVTNWQKEARFPIRYFWQENKGKHVAFNYGVSMAYGELFLPLDSDDACVPEALERFKYHWDSIPPAQRVRFSGVCALCKDQEGRLVGDPFPFEITDSNSLEIYYRYKVKGEKWGFQRTEVLRMHPYPELDKVKYIPEGIIWNAIAKSYQIRFVNEMLRIYWIEEPNRSDQITQSLRKVAYNASGNSYYYESCLNHDIIWFSYAPLEFLRSAAHYIRFSLHAGTRTFHLFRDIRPLMSKVLVFLAIPIGVILYLFEKKNLNIISWYKTVIKRK